MAIFSFGDKRVQQRCGTSATNNNQQRDSDTSRRNRRSSYKFRNWLGLQQLKLHDHKSRSSIPVHEFLSRARNDESDCNPKSHRGYQRNRHNKYLYPVKTLCLSVLTAVVTAPAHAADVGGVSATANPIANSSGSVTNQAIQVLQGPYITNTYGNGISCQGPTANFTPYITHATNDKDPFETFYMEPQYDNRDFEGRLVEVTKNVKNWPWEPHYDDRTYTNADGETVRAYEDGQDMTITVMEMQGDGVPDNPGRQLWQKPVRTGMARNSSTSVGLSATLSLPLDGSLQEQCKEAAATQIALQGQMLANKRLDFELARLKNCGELMQKGIQFHPRSPYAKVCADVVVMNKNAIAPHIHSIPSPSVSESRDSESAAPPASPVPKAAGSSYPVRQQSSSSPSSLPVSQPLTKGQQEALRAVRNSSLPLRWRQ